MAITQTVVPKESDRYKFTRLVNDPTVGTRDSLWRPPKFRSDFDYVEHVVVQQDVGRLDLLSQKYYGQPYYWWAIALVNNIGNSFTELHAANGEKVKARVSLLNALSEEAVDVESLLSGIEGNILSVNVQPGTVSGWRLDVYLGAELKEIWDNSVLYPETNPAFIGNLNSKWVEFTVFKYDSLMVGVYDLSGGESWTQRQILKIPTMNEVDFALSNTVSNDT